MFVPDVRSTIRHWELCWRYETVLSDRFRALTSDEQEALEKLFEQVRRDMLLILVVLQKG